MNSTRDRILKAGLKTFSKKGYLGATTREIAREAGIAEVTLFRHFPSKQKLFEEMINSYSFLPALKGLLPELKGMSYRESLSEIARRFLERLEERSALIRIMHSERHRYPDKIRKVYRALIDGMVETLASYFEDMQKKGHLRKFNAGSGARAFLGMFFSYFNTQELMMNKRDRFADSESTIREFVEIFVEGTVR
jgi:AcrR family transcriptional regulator